ncbi:GTP-binding protein [Streptomyces sp. NPDC051644]|uniref:GTP-binding protein n=1 Tax=unclassified Streptomyces TaxID=2593676 RepID=UPI00379E57B6
MAYVTGSDADVAWQGAAPPAELKIVIAGGFGVGKTTLIRTLSEIEPLTTEARLSAAGTGVDDLEGIAGKTTTTVAMDFGRITFDDPDPMPMILFLFGVPGQERFWFMWDDLGRGAVGAVVLVDTRRLEDSFTAVNWYEQQKMPFVVAVNEFDGAHRYEADEVRQALSLGDHVPVVKCDVREHASANNVLITLVCHSLDVRHAITTGAST